MIPDDVPARSFLRLQFRPAAGGHATRIRLDETELLERVPQPPAPARRRRRACAARNSSPRGPPASNSRTLSIPSLVGGIEFNRSLRPMRSWPTRSAIAWRGWLRAKVAEPSRDFGRDCLSRGERAPGLVCQNTGGQVVGRAVLGGEQAAGPLLAERPPAVDAGLGQAQLADRRPRLSVPADRRGERGRPSTAHTCAISLTGGSRSRPAGVAGEGDRVQARCARASASSGIVRLRAIAPASARSWLPSRCSRWRSRSGRTRSPRRSRSASVRSTRRASSSASAVAQPPTDEALAARRDADRCPGREVVKCHRRTRSRLRPGRTPTARVRAPPRNPSILPDSTSSVSSSAEARARCTQRGEPQAVEQHRRGRAVDLGEVLEPLLSLPLFRWPASSLPRVPYAHIVLSRWQAGRDFAVSGA